MPAPNILPVILCGGDGTRLWPLSRQGFPKQFLPLFGNRSLLELTLERLAAFGQLQAIAGEQHRFLINEASERAGVPINQILEPCGRDTAAAMALAALRADPAVDLLLFCPADHYIPETDKFLDMVRGATDVALSGNIVTFGVEPSVPSTSFGYIELGECLSDGAWRGMRFWEKPDRQRAMEFTISKKYLWNSGMFMMRPSVLREALSRHVPEMFEICKRAVANGETDGTFFRPGPEYQDTEAKSIDYAVMEKEDRIAVFPFAGHWYDIGSWDAISEVAEKLEDGNLVLGGAENIKLLNTHNTLIHSSEGRVAVLIGVHDLVIVDTPDALLVAKRDQVSSVKSAVQDLKTEGWEQAVSHRKVARPWGSFESIEKKNKFQVKRISVKPGGKLSLQSHQLRSEHWVVVSGTAHVYRGGEEFELQENQSTYIPRGVVHRLQNREDCVLDIIEIQTGDYLGEDDIERFEDIYGRDSSST